MRATSSTRSISRVDVAAPGGRNDFDPPRVGRQFAVAQRRENPPRRIAGSTLDAQHAVQLREAEHDRLALRSGGGRRRSRPRPADRRPAPESVRSTGGWPNRPPGDRARARSDRTNRCAGSACGPCCGSTAGRTRRLRSAARSCAAETSVSAPPITPPMPTARCGVGDHADARVERVGLVVDGQEVFAGAAPGGR